MVWVIVIRSRHGAPGVGRDHGPQLDVVAAGMVGVVDAQGDAPVDGLPAPRQHLVVLRQPPGRGAGRPDEAHDARVAGVDLGADAGPLAQDGLDARRLATQAQGQAGRRVRTQGLEIQVAQRDPHPVQRLHLAPHEGAEARRAVRRAASAGRPGRAMPAS